MSLLASFCHHLLDSPATPATCPPCAATAESTASCAATAACRGSASQSLQQDCGGQGCALQRQKQGPEQEVAEQAACSSTRALRRCSSGHHSSDIRPLLQEEDPVQAHSCPLLVGRQDKWLQSKAGKACEFMLEPHRPFRTRRPSSSSSTASSMLSSWSSITVSSVGPSPWPQGHWACEQEQEQLGEQQGHEEGLCKVKGLPQPSSSAAASRTLLWLGCIPLEGMPEDEEQEAGGEQDLACMSRSPSLSSCASWKALLFPDGLAGTPYLSAAHRQRGWFNM